MLIGTLTMPDSPDFRVSVVGTYRKKITYPSEMFVRISISRSLSLELMILAETTALSFGVIIAGHLKVDKERSLRIVALKTNASIFPQIEIRPKNARSKVPIIKRNKPIVR